MGRPHRTLISDPPAPEQATDGYRLATVVRRHWRGFGLGGILVAANVLIHLALPFIIRYLIDALSAGTLTMRTLAYGVLGYAACIPPAATISYWMRRLPLKAAHAVEYQVRQDLFAHLVRQDPTFFSRQRIGDLLTRMGSDLIVVRDALGHGILHGTRSTVAMLAAFSVLFSRHAMLSAWLLLLMLGMALSFTLVLGAIRRRHGALQAQTSDLGHTVEETFSGIRTVKGFALEARRRDRFARENRGLRRRAMALSLVSEPIWPLFAFWFSLQMVVLLVYGGRLVLRGTLSLGDLVLVNQYLLYLQWPILSLGWIGNLLQRSHISWERLMELFATAPVIVDGPRTQRSITRLRGEICFEGVGLQLGGQTLIEDLNLTIPAGSTLGITGPIGAGKTLLVSLVARLLDPSRGEIRIDGHPLPEIPLAVLRGHIGLAPQETLLFSDTLANNLAFGLARHDPARPFTTDTLAILRETARTVQLEREIERFPEGLETRVGERGVTLSGGQRQRVSLARALARDPAILMLDDVLASVDTQTEAAILETLVPLTRGRTTLIVSHRLSALRGADQIIVLQNGRIAEHGTHAELLAREGYYAGTYRLQQMAGSRV